MKRGGLLTINEPNVKDNTANCLDEAVDTSVERSVCYTDTFEKSHRVVVDGIGAFVVSRVSSDRIAYLRNSEDQT